MNSFLKVTLPNEIFYLKNKGGLVNMVSVVIQSIQCVDNDHHVEPN